MNLYLNRHGTNNIGFTFNNKTHWFMHASCLLYYIQMNTYRFNRIHDE